MTKEQFEREKKYWVALSVVKTMLERGLLNEKEYAKFNLKLIKKYNPVASGLSR